MPRIWYPYGVANLMICLDFFCVKSYFLNHCVFLIIRVGVFSLDFDTFAMVIPMEHDILIKSEER